MEVTSRVPPFRALILEDHDFQRHIGVQILKHCGASEVLEASGGAIALDLVRTASSPIDVLLCDLNMPGMDGLAFLRHIAEQGSTSSVILGSSLDPAIIRTAEIMAKSYGIRLLGVVEKPLSGAKLMPLLLRHFSPGKASARPTIQAATFDEVKSGISQRQFGPFFQPQVDMRSGALVGVEALMRWHHPSRGLVPPAVFIPVMESAGLISPATLMMIEESLIHCRRWRAAGLEVPIAVNLSPESLRDTSLPEQIEALTQAAGIAPGALTIEITETVAMTDLGHSMETLARLRIKGFNLSIDDYGTGFSSMQQLTRLPLTEIKIDQSFVTGAAERPILRALIETSVVMAKRLGLRTVAEGVETAEDWDVCARLGCETAQGYFIGRPMPGEAIAGWYQGWLASRPDGAARAP